MHSNKLTVAAVNAAKPPKQGTRKMADGHGLTLLLNESGRKAWRFRYRYLGTERMISLGLFPDVGLHAARKARDEARKVLARGTDPSAHRQAEKAAAKIARGYTFKAVAEAWLELHARASNPPSPKTLNQARSRLKKWVYPSVGDLPINEIRGKQITGLLRRIEARGVNETAHKVRRLVDRVFRFALDDELVEKNPTPHVDSLVPVKSEGFPFISDPDRFGALLRAIEGYDGGVITAFALRLAPHVFLRSFEFRAAEWGEIDFEKKEWHVPAQRMKKEKAHIVPLSSSALDILRELYELTGPDGYLFPSVRSDYRPMSDGTINAALRQMGFMGDEHVMHGFRKTSSTMLNEMGRFSSDVIEVQQARTIRGVRGVYNKAQYLPERRKMMEVWSNYLGELRVSCSRSNSGRNSSSRAVASH